MTQSPPDAPEHSSPVGRFQLFRRRRTKPGTRPGVVVADPESPKPQITVIRYNSEEFLEEADVTVDSIRPAGETGTVTWVNVNGLGDSKAIKTIGEHFGLHGLVQEDIVNVHQRAKVEDYDDHLFVVARMVSRENQRLSIEQISLILGADFVVTFQERVGDCLDPVRKRLRKQIGRLRSAGADYLAYAILDAIVDGYFPVLDQYSELLDQLEEGMATQQSRDVVAGIHRLRGEFHVLRKAIWPHRELFNSLIRDMESRFDKETRTYLRDCYDHTIQIIDVVDASREIASDIRDFHFTQVSLKQNEIMKVLTIVSSVFIPLGFVAGLYGMNFDSEVSDLNMPELHWAYGYPTILAVMLTITTGMITYFWRRGWLK